MKEEESEFRADAKQMVDAMFECKLFDRHLTRDEMNALENWLDTSMTVRYNSAKKLEELMNNINKTND